LTLSWRDNVALANRLRDLPGLIEHRCGQPLREALDQYTDDARPNAVLLSPGAWEGVDLPGKIAHLVITRIPFPPPNNAMALHRRVSLEGLGFAKDKINSIVHNEQETTTRRKLSQGIGRGIRKVTDSVTLWVADPRFPMPDSFSDSLDDVLLAASTHHRRPILRECIPVRFRETTYLQSAIWLAEGRKHFPIAVE
jgi:ATP-dependent DNA helicase DinG